MEISKIEEDLFWHLKNLIICFPLTKTFDMFENQIINKRHRNSFSGPFILVFSSTLLLWILLFLSGPELEQQIAVAQIKKPPSIPFLTYTNPKLGISILYPASWQKIELPQNSTANPSNRPGVVVTFVSPPTDIFHDLKEYVNIVVEKVTPNTTLNNYTALVLSELKTAYPQYHLSSNVSNSTLAGQPASSIMLSHVPRVFGSLQIKEISLFTIKNNEAYIVAYGWPSVEFNHVLLEPVNKMVKSFNITATKTSAT